jgi:hypothetical protein
VADKRKGKHREEDDDEAVRDEAIMSADDTGMVRNEAQIVSVEENEKLEGR